MRNIYKTQVLKACIIILTLFCSGIAYAQCPTLIWADEFNGTTLDQNKWSYQIGDGCAEGICGWGNSELQYYQESNVTVSNGQLHITAKKQRVQSKAYTSGRIRSINKGDWTYGRFEARIKLPAGKGLWPAFWMLPTDQVYGGWPRSGEIDIMEFVAAETDRVLGTVHYGDPYPNNRNQGAYYILNSGTFPDTFHDFAIEWEPGVIRWFVDDVLFLTKTAQDLAPYNWPFDQRFHFLLNVAVGGNLGGPVDDSIFPKTMDVDYVRVYNGFKPYATGKRVVLNKEAGVSYSIGNLANGTSVNWTVPAGATIVSGQGSASITVNFGDASGNVTASFSTTCGSQQISIPVTVEPPFVKEFSFENFDDPATVTLGNYTGSFSKVANPSATGVNTSAMSGKYTRNATQQYDILTYNVSNIADASQYVNKNKKFYIDVYTSAPVGTEIILQLETSTATSSNYPTGRHSHYSGKTTVRNQWQRIPFALLDKPDAAASNTGVTRMILLFASNTYTGDTYYFDNLDSYQASTGQSTSPTSMSVTSIVTGTAGAGGGSKYGLATVTVRDNLGNPVPNATVTGTFSGSFNETRSGVTGANGTVNIQTTASAKGTVNVDFCVNTVTHATLAYNASQNTITCTGAASLSANSAQNIARANTATVQVYPNPSRGAFNVYLDLPTESDVQLTLINVQGKIIEKTQAVRLLPGSHALNFNKQLPEAGLYLIKLRVNDKEYLIRHMNQK